MRRSLARFVPLLGWLCAACSSSPEPGTAPAPSASDAATDDAAAQDSGRGPTDSGAARTDGPEADAASEVATDAGNACSVSGAPGVCITQSACAALANHTSFAGHCSGPASIECCIKTPNVADNPPIPAGYKLLAQAQVTPEMTSWAVSILHDPVTYPMFATTTKPFGALVVLARVEWHPPDFLNSAVHRGVTLYQPG